MKGIYLASYKALHPNYDIVYQDINGKRDLGGDMLDVDLSKYDFVIATPPCNYWSIANYRRETSEYSLKTKMLLPNILKKLCNQKKPFIVENVRNSPLFNKYGLMNLPCFIHFYGRHTYWTNVMLNFETIHQKFDNIHFEHTATRQGGENVFNTIEHFLEVIH
jgi:site-specific DNA-cytosine methylase